MNNIKEFIRIIFTGATRTHVATYEQRQLFSDINISQILNENIKNEHPFSFSKNGKKYTIKNI